jgi:hypothetical protein
MCNADLTKLVGDGVVTSFSTADLKWCSFCPVRSYDKTAGVVTNEVGTFAVTQRYVQEIIFCTRRTPGVFVAELVEWILSTETTVARQSSAKSFKTPSKITTRKVVL